MSRKTLVIVILVVLIVLYYAYTHDLLSGSMQSPDKVCGSGYGSRPGSSASLDCMRSLWLDSKCTDKGSIWSNALDPSIPPAQAAAKVDWWSKRPLISDIQTDMNAYYSQAAAGNTRQAANCGI